MTNLDYGLGRFAALGAYFQLITVDRPKKAIEALELNIVDLVLLDLSLPTLYSRIFDSTKLSEQ